MNDFVVTTELGIVFEQRIQAVWALGENGPHVVFRHRRNVGLSQFLEQKFFAQAASGLASTFFFSAQYSKIHTGVLEQFHHGPADTLGAAIVGAGATNPIKQIKLSVLFRLGYA